MTLFIIFHDVTLRHAETQTDKDMRGPIYSLYERFVLASSSTPPPRAIIMYPVCPFVLLSIELYKHITSSLS